MVFLEKVRAGCLCCPLQLGIPSICPPGTMLDALQIFSYSTCAEQ